ncbi:TetR/AcrR family transcriptional regulator [Sphingobium lactosutens]|uniref:HTH tetR-type domain-containing protein n=1 Tax=Sphingobium lactosutens DS20 TaxID=1331060 RepID=T0J5B6_9SPHN|nr:TetR family transcriptional regulator [Sphingobium lactosutens]EQB17174.1 hypothetical protein RLDS_04270 [Sphingobium lactosutens DS20]
MSSAASTMQTEVAAAPRGRPRTFDREVALRKAMTLFWTKGFEATSMQDLVGTMGINSPSIYAAYGSKEDLFREAVALYADAEGGATLRALTGDLSARAAIEVLLKENVKLFTGSDRPRGCLIVLGAGNVADDHAAIQMFLRGRRREISEAFIRRLTRAVKDGELPEETEVEALAALCVTFLNGLSIQATDGVSRDVLIKAVDRLMAIWPQAASLRSVSKRPA